MVNKKIPNDILLIIHRYVHRFHIHQINKYYLDSVTIGCGLSYCTYRDCQCIKLWGKTYNYRTLSSGYHLYVFNQKDMSVYNLPKIY
jgi:hypothetical protein